MISDLQKNNVENSVNFVSKKFNKEIFSAKIKSLISNLLKKLKIAIIDLEVIPMLTQVMKL